MLSVDELAQTKQLAQELHTYLSDLQEACVRSDRDRYAEARAGWTTAHEALVRLLPPTLQPIRMGQRLFVVPDEPWTDAT